jgi:hypothetical protein
MSAALPSSIPARLKIVRCPQRRIGRSPILLAMFLAVFLFSPGFSETKPEARVGTYLRRAVISQAAGAVRITANSPRPLEQVLDALRQKYGWVVDYEDPQFVSQLDLIDGPAPQSWLPSGGTFSLEFPADAPLAEKTLHQLVDSYNESKNPGRFELRETAGGSYAVVGTAAHDEKGKVSTQTPLLDSLITLPARERTIAETISLICRRAGNLRHSAVYLGVAPTALLDYTRVAVGGNKVPARDLLRQALMAAHRNLYWRLLFDPKSKSYYLDIHSAERS